MQIYTHRIVFLFLIILACPLHTPLYAAESPLQIENAWVAEAPPVSRVMVAYMIFRNSGSESIKLVKAESDSFKNVEFHETTEKDGVAGMVYHESLSIPAGSKIELQRGGLHLMLFDPNRPLKAGDTVNFTFTTGDGRSITKTVKVRRR